jgi:hypothetical protein
MIHYQLRCGTGHQFDGWFAGSAGFEAQAEAGLVACPHCASTDVSRALMAPGLARKGRKAAPVIAESGEEVAPARPAPPAGTPSPIMDRAASGVMPDQVRAVLTKLRAEVEAHCDYVGENFATEARRIHNGETAPRGIYGESTPAEAEALADDGIDVARIPWLPRADS